MAIKIEKMTFGGGGLGHADGKVCFVPFTAPGDLAQSQGQDRKTILYGRLPDRSPRTFPSRVEPPCPVFGRCGGCNWQHLPYEVQLDEKWKIFAEIMWRSARVDSDRILPIIPAPEPYGYRATDPAQGQVGDMESRTSAFTGAAPILSLPLPGSCAIAHPAINRMLPEIHQLMRLFTEPDKIPQIDIAAGDDGATAAVFHYIGADPKAAAAFLEDNRHLLPSCCRDLPAKRAQGLPAENMGTDTLNYRIPKESLTEDPEQKLSFAPGGFSQINYPQNRALIAAVPASLDLTGEERVLDIYLRQRQFFPATSRHVPGSRASKSTDRPSRTRRAMRRRMPG